jgi:hypothetical protein
VANTPTIRSFEGGSFRDRDGRVFYGESGEVLRALSAHALAEWEAVAASRFYQRGITDGGIVATERVEAGHVGASPADGEWAAVLKHETIPFVSYPYEWTFGMLKDAALLHLGLLQTALAEGFTIKDGTAYNVQWIGPRPVFIDVASFERLAAGQLWAGYRQFCQTFLFPLFLQAYKGVAFQPALRGCLDGIKPEEFANLMSFRDLFRRGVLAHAYLHGKLEASRLVRENNPQDSLHRAGFAKALIETNVARLTRIVGRLNWSPPESKWSAYATDNSYSPADRERKATFVRDAVRQQRPGLVWDLGCNTGEYSRIAAESANYVIAMDADHLAVDRLYQSLKADGRANGRAPILPLVSNVADPSANLGWRGRERKTLPERGRPGMILCLALVHHLVIGCGIPLLELLEWLAGLGTSVVIEFVDKADPMVGHVLGSRRDIYADYSPHQFEKGMNDFFEVVRCERLGSGTRTLYYAVSRCVP